MASRSNKDGDDGDEGDDSDEVYEKKQSHNGRQLLRRYEDASCCEKGRQKVADE